MSSLTIKDFILYNSPCFNCKTPILLKFLADRKDAYSNLVPFIIPQVYGSELDLDIPISGKGTLKLKIDGKTNKFETPSIKHLTKFLEEHTLLMLSACSKCYTSIVSSNLDFNIKGGFIHPLSIDSETLYINDKNTQYSIRTNVNTNSSEVMVRKINSTKTQLSNTIDLPAIPLGKFKTKERMLKKLKMYVLFS